MDKDPIREELIKVTAERDVEISRARKAEQDLTALRSHNLELVEALNKIYSMPISSGFGDEQRIAQKALSSPQSEKYLKMVRVVECAENYVSVRGMIHNINPETGKEHCDKHCFCKLQEALKSYNSEKGE